jgi:hypothetical protein
LEQGKLDEAEKLYAALRSHPNEDIRVGFYGTAYD